MVGGRDSLTRYQFEVAMRFNPKRWLANVIIATIDIVPNAILGGAPDETLSSRMGRAKDRPKGFGPWLSRTICKGLDWLDPGHCDKVEKRETSEYHRPESLDDQPKD